VLIVFIKYQHLQPTAGHNYTGPAKAYGSVTIFPTTIAVSVGCVKYKRLMLGIEQ
jgi:hypothetical protein